jgi:hypothetical protein
VLFAASSSAGLPGGSLAGRGPKRLRGDDYLVHVALPSFFYATMVYAILRHNGFDLGKMDYVGSLPTREG